MFVYCAGGTGSDKVTVVRSELFVLLSRHSESSGCCRGSVFDEFDFEEGVDVFGGCFQGKVLDASEGSGLQGLDVGCYFLAW